MSASSHTKQYVVLWVVLLVALGISLVLGILDPSPAVIAVIFTIAAVKAYLVVAYYMHLALEPRFLKLVFVGAVAAVACLFVGLYPDVGARWAVVEQSAVAEQPKPEVAELKPADAARGQKVFSTYCVGCHQADGTGKDGTMAANFRDDKERMAKPDAELLHSIREGKTGKIGTMPAWGKVINEQQQVDALAYVRTFGASHP